MIRRGQFISINADRLAPVALTAVLGNPAAIGRKVIQALTGAARDEWIRLGQTELKTTSSTYINAIQEAEIEGRRGRIVLEGVLPNMVEQGHPAYDLRAALCWNPEAKNRKPILKNGFVVGYYNTIPMRHGTPGTTGRAFPTMMEQYKPGSGASFGATLGVQERRRLADLLHSVAKQLSPTVRTQTSGTLWGARLAEKTIESLGIGKLQPHHKSSPFAGMVREQSAYESAIQTQYMTWRTISTRQKTGWMHPGIQARQLHLKVAEYLGKISEAVWNDAVGGAV
jgi:hypothetical protein